jgi:hypothetical protein
VNPCFGLTINQWTGNAGTNVWGTAGNWQEGNVPNSGDQATAYSGNIALTSTPASVGGLLLGKISSTPTLDTDGFKLDVLGTAAVNGGILYTASAPSGSVSLQAATVTLTDGALLDSLSTSSNILVSSTSGTANGTLSVDGTSSVLSNGTISAGSYTNNGSLEAIGTTVINAGTFTMQGSSSAIATIDAAGSSTTINATTFELHDFNSSIDLGTAGSSLSLQGTVDYTPGYIGASVSVGDTSTLTLGSGSWVFGYLSGTTPHGNVTLSGGPTLARAAQMIGECVFFTNVNVSGYATISSAEFDGGSTTTVAANSYLYLNSPYFRGSSTNSVITLNGPGTYEMSGAMQIGYSASGVAYTTVNVNSGTIFNWNGISGTTPSCSITNGELDIYTSTIGVPASNNSYSGAITVTGGAKLNVAGTAWTYYGAMTLDAGAIVQGQTITIDGSNLPAGTYSLNPSSSGTTFPVIQAPVIFNPNTTIYMGFTGGLHLDGPTTWAGGGVVSAPYVTANGPYGTLVQDGNATVTANTTIQCDVLDMDGTSNTATWTINPGVTFTQQAYSLDTVGSTTNPFHSTLNLNGGTINMLTASGVWTLAGGTINMTQSGLNFAFVEGQQLILGSGSVNGTINVSSGSIGEVTAPLQLAATTVAGGNVINTAANAILCVYAFSSDANAMLTKTGPGTWYVFGGQNHSAGSQIVVSQGQLVLDSNAGSGGANLNLNASGGLITLNASEYLATLSIATGAQVVAAAQASPNPKLLIETTLNMSGGTIDLQSNDMICNNGNLAALTQLTKTGYANGTWTGVGGIDSSTAGADSSHLHALGVILNDSATNQPLYPTFDGEASGITDVLIKYTYYGDATLDGKVDGSDYSRIDNGLAKHLTGWSNGDFNYDGVVNGSDYALIDNAFNSQGAQIAAAISASQIAAVPEPASCAMMAAPLIAMLGRCRRRRW